MKKIALILGLVALVFTFASCDDDDTQVSYDSLPTTAKTFIETHFGGVTVRLVEKDNDSYDVYLSNGYEIDFDKQGTWDNVDGNYQKLPASFLALSPIDVIATYVATQYPSLFITQVDKDVEKNGYEVTLNNNVELIFNWDGTFRSIDY